MPAPILMLDTTVEIQKTLGSAITITGITKASPGVATATAHGLSNGAVGILSVTGMIELNQRMVRIASVATNTFALEGIDTTNFTTFVSGTFTPITAFDTFANVTGISIPEPQPNRKDATTVNLTFKKEIFGLDDALVATLNVQSDPKDVAIVNVRAASKAKATRGFRITLQDDTILLMNCYVAGGRGLDGQVGAIATGQVNLTLAAEEQYL